MKNDLQLIADYKKKCKINKILNCPIIGFHGAEDPLIASMDGWGDFTMNEYNTICFSGNHFFLYEKNNCKRIIESINDSISMCGGEQRYCTQKKMVKK